MHFSVCNFYGCVTNASMQTFLHSLLCISFCKTLYTFFYCFVFHYWYFFVQFRLELPLLSLPGVTKLLLPFPAILLQAVSLTHRYNLHYSSLSPCSTLVCPSVQSLCLAQPAPDRWKEQLPLVVWLCSSVSLVAFFSSRPR